MFHNQSLRACVCEAENEQAQGSAVPNLCLLFKI